MKMFVYTVSWKVKGGIQFGYAYVNAKNKTEAKRYINKAIPSPLYPYFFIYIHKVDIFPYNHILKDDVRLWYFTGNKLFGSEKEICNIYKIGE